MARACNTLGSSNENPIDLSNNKSATRRPVCVIESDDDDDIDEIDFTGPITIPKSNGRIDDDDAELEDDESDIARRISDSEERNFQRALALHNALPRGHKAIGSAKSPCDLHVKEEMGVQLFENEHGQTHFFWIKQIIQDEKGEVYLRGISLKRHFDIYPGISKDTGQALLAILPTKTNELCMHLMSPPHQLGSPLRNECLVSVSLRDVYCERKIVFTNYDFPAFNYQGRGMSVKIDRNQVYEHGVLVCRWKYVEEVKYKKAVPTQIAPLDQEECDPDKARSDVIRRRGYGKLVKQSPTQRSRANVRPTLQSQLVDLTIRPTFTKKRTYEEVEEEKISLPDRNLTIKRRATSTVQESLTPIFRSRLPRTQQHTKAPATRRARVYSFGDGCAGGGGTLRAAEMAGFDIDWAIDKWDVAVKTNHKNWPHLRHRILCIEIQEFVRKIELDKDYAVDVIHISFPCQPHSWQNRGQNPERDIENAAPITNLEQLLKHLRPRIVTLEQTNGILTKNEGFWFRKILSLLTTEGYGALCDVFNMAHYEVPSTRRRLIIVAACPGQKLPNWPLPTRGPGLKDPVTAGEAIRDIPADDPFHDVAEQKRQFRANPSALPVADMNIPLKRIIDTNGARILLRDDDSKLYKPTHRQQMR